MQTLEKELGYSFKDGDLLQLALTHPSTVRDREDPTILPPHNQRLEFLGDSVISLVLAEALYAKFPESSEGPLTKARAQLVNKQSLARQALEIRLQDHLILSKAEESNGGRTRPSILSDAFEALIGAIFLDGGFDEVKKVVLCLFRELLEGLDEPPELHNPKGELQEKLQSRSTEAPSYELISAEGPEHDRSFECAVYHEGKELGRGRGKTKREAESQAAQVALKGLEQS